MFLSMDEPEAVISVIEKYSDFKAMYGQIYEICQNIEEVMGMFSKELRELDRNTVQLMIDVFWKCSLCQRAYASFLGRAAPKPQAIFLLASKEIWKRKMPGYPLDPKFAPATQ